MTDVLTPEQRRRCMSRIRGTDTKPEMLVRRLVHAMGYRFRLHRRDLPGKPDIVLPRHRKVILVHGCFWHRHSCKLGRPQPKHNARFWNQKLDANVARDRRASRDLRREGWQVLVIWECETRNRDRLTARINSFLGAAPAGGSRPADGAWIGR